MAELPLGAMRRFAQATAAIAKAVELPAVYDALSARQRVKVREAYTEQQDGLCYHCRMPLDGPPDAGVQCAPINERLYPPGFFDHPVHLHHSHRTGLTLGAVHPRCNAVLWEHHGE